MTSPPARLEALKQLGAPTCPRCSSIVTHNELCAVKEHVPAAQTNAMVTVDWPAICSECAASIADANVRTLSPMLRPFGAFMRTLDRAVGRYRRQESK